VKRLLPLWLVLLIAPLSMAAVNFGEIGFEQLLNETVSPDLMFRDEAGRPARLAQYLEGKPALLVLTDYRCRKLCGLILDGLAESLAAGKLKAGKTFRVIVVSLAPGDTAAAVKKTELAARHPLAGVVSGWRFLSGDGQNIEKLAQSVGFRYAYDPVVDQYAHPAGIVLLTGAGRIARYFYGIRFAALDLRLGLAEAAGGRSAATEAAGRIGSPVERLLLLCYDYDPTSGHYGFLVMKTLRLAGLATAVSLGGLITLLWVRDRRRRTQAAKRGDVNATAS
jgi:protein SCO1/2